MMMMMMIIVTVTFILCLIMFKHLNISSFFQKMGNQFLYKIFMEFSFLKWGKDFLFLPKGNKKKNTRKPPTNDRLPLNKQIFKYLHMFSEHFVDNEKDFQNKVVSLLADCDRSCIWLVEMYFIEKFFNVFICRIRI